MGRGDSSWQDRNHRGLGTGKNIWAKKHKNNSAAVDAPKVEETTPTPTPTVDTSVGTEGYDYTKDTTAKPYDPSSNLQVGESIMSSGGTGANETYDFSKGSKGVSTPSVTSKKRKSSLKINIRGAGGTGRNIV